MAGILSARGLFAALAIGAVGAVVLFALIRLRINRRATAALRARRQLALQRELMPSVASALLALKSRRAALLEQDRQLLAEWERRYPPRRIGVTMR
jgi:hypothetical protein